MDGTLAQLAALVSHGSAWLREPVSAPPDLRASSTFRYVRSVRLELRSRGLLRRPVVADDPARWFEQLRARGVRALRLDPRGSGDVVPLPRHLAAAFANSAKASIVAVADPPERWVGTWTVGPVSSERRWTVEYLGDIDPGAEVPTIEVAAARASLHAALESARDFAGRQRWAAWADVFDGALRAGDADPPEIAHHPDMLPAATDLARRRVLAMATRAWVFGGMGSWNDLGADDPSEQAEYDRISAILYDAVLAAVAAAVNGPA
jgi:hypothetical protein